MSLLKKSQENKQAFLLLKDRQKGVGFFSDSEDVVGYRSPAIHCCYYSCFQKLLYILKEFYPDSFEEDPKIGHGSQIKIFFNCVGREFDSQDLFDLRYVIIELKTLRNKVDYKDFLPNDKELSIAENHLNTFHGILKGVLSI